MIKFFVDPPRPFDPFDDDVDVFVPPLDVVARRTARAPRRGTRAVVAIARGGARARATDAMASRSADRSRRVRVTSRRDLDGAATMTASTVRIEMDARVGAGDRALRAFASSSGQSRGARTRGTVTTTNDDDDDDDPRWVVCSGRPFRGRVRVIADANALASLVVERVTVEWVGRERVGAEERSVARSPPGEVARALTLEPGSTVGLKFGIDLPPGLAPSFRGEHSRYWYRVTCKATTASGETLEASAPLTVRAGDWDLERRGEDDGELCDDVGDDDDVGEMRETYSARDLTAPWIHIEDTVPPESPRFNGSLASPRALQMWGDVEPQVRTPRESSTPQAGEGSVFTPQSHGQRKKSKAYVVSMGEDRLVKVTLRKPAPKCAIGGEVAGILDFTCAEPGKARASHVLITLESSEIIHAEAKTVHGGKPPVYRKIWVQTHERVEHLNTSNFALNLPANSPGSFRTSKVELKWQLRFEITSVKKTPAGEFAAFFKGQKHQSEISTLEWILPLDVGTDWLTNVTKIPKISSSSKIRRESSLVAMHD